MADPIKLSWPVKSPVIVTQYWGENPWFYSNTNEHPAWSYPGHNGVDFAGFVGDPCMAGGNETVTYVGFEEGGYGNYIRSILSNGWWAYYAHLSKIIVKVGQKVPIGQVIGEIGATGCATGAHLHYGLKDPTLAKSDPSGYKGYQNPLPLLDWVDPPVTPTPPASGKKQTASVIGSVNMRNGPSVTAMHYGTLFSAHPAITIDELKTLQNGDLWARHDYYWFCIQNGKQKLCNIK